MKDLKIDESTGLVLEGGGMRGVFTCGVLDYFMDHDIRFPYAIGVSAGACNGLSYASRQRGRAKYSNIDLLEKYDYIGLKHLLKKRNILDFDLLFNYEDFILQVRLSHIRTLPDKTLSTFAHISRCGLRLQVLTGD